MEVLKLTTKINESGHLNIDIPTNLEAVEVELVVIINPVSVKKKKKPNYDFSDLAARLSWQGDGVEMQNTLRYEW